MAKLQGHITINSQICKGCELCIVECPQNGMGLSQGMNRHGYHYAILAKDVCTGCTNCALVCPEAAIRVFRESKQKIPAPTVR
jgi:2-oxoglutarate ferredoxin oxidoreductase subunit delta